MCFCILKVYPKRTIKNPWYKINNYIYLIKYNSNYGVEHHYSPYISFLICYYLIILKIDRVERLNWDTKANMV